jgi:hypothetical protein
MLVDYQTATRHLRLYELASTPEVEADVRGKLAEAHALVMTHLKTHRWDPPPTWDETTDPATDFQFALARSAVLMVLSNLWRFRGDDETTGGGNGPLTPRVVEVLSQLRDPSFA